MKLSTVAPFFLFSSGFAGATTRLLAPKNTQEQATPANVNGVIAKNDALTKVERAAIHVMMQGKGMSEKGEEPAHKHVWSLGPFSIDAYCDKPKTFRGPRSTWLQLKITITNDDPNDDLYVIGRAGYSGFFDSGVPGNKHKLGPEETFEDRMLYSDHEATALGEGGLYAMKKNGEYYYVGWNAEQFIGLQEDDLEISEFLGVDGLGEDAVDCLMMGSFEYYKASPNLK